MITFNNYNKTQDESHRKVLKSIYDMKHINEELIIFKN